ncbi:MAG TPA: hypothetical protein EYN03_08965, partial [Planctomycetes bacterium]|nr:hypothetical protein [Planctomycetota bacterium]
ERSDPFVPGTMIEKYELREGVLIRGTVQHARYLYKTDRPKTAVLSYRASYSLQQACQAKPALPTEKIGTFP